VDVLADLLARARATGALFADSTLHAPWGLEFCDRTPLSFHAVLDGKMVVEVDGASPWVVEAGDVLLVASGPPYRFLSSAGVPPRPLEEVVSPGAGRVHVLHGPGEPTRLLCGAFRFGGTVSRALLDLLPPLVVLPAAAAPADLRAAVALLALEVRGEAPGAQAALDRLLDLLLVLAVRAWAADEPPAWVAALDDPVAGPALRALHAEPAQQWSVARLATDAGLSRAAFARRFATATGTSPMAYLTAWRMQLAADALMEPGATLAQVAHEIGYGSEYAFATAFKRHYGTAPGRWRTARAA